MTKDTTSLVFDYVAFGFCIIVCSGVPIYYQMHGPKEKTKADYVFATGSVSIAAMMLSIARGTLGVRSFLGYPSELFYHGSAMWETLYGTLLAFPIVSFFLIPVYFNLGITSVYQYLDYRFKSRLVRSLASGTYIVRQLLNQGVTVFTPCVALYTVIGLPYWVSILLITVISIIFSVIGGLKAAIQNDVIQGTLMIAVSVAVIGQGWFEVGSVKKVYEINKENNRLEFFNFDLDPTLRVTTTSAVIGQLFMSLSIYGCQQNFVQRYCSMGSVKEVTKTMMYNIPVIAVLFSLSWVVGMVIYAVYFDCDPLSTGYIFKFDEIVPFFVEDRFHYLPGILGLFMAALFNGALSLNVSNINALATVIWEDFVSEIRGLKKLDDYQQLIIIKVIAMVIGFIIMGMAFMVSLFSGVIESSMIVTSATSGPLLGIFILAMFVPCANWKGAASGMISAHCIILWITIGSLSVQRPDDVLKPSIDGCDNNSFNDHIMKPGHIWPTTHLFNFDQFSNSSQSANKGMLTSIYSISYMYYAFIGCIITLVVGYLVSKMCYDEYEDVYDENLLHPITKKFRKPVAHIELSKYS